MSRIKETKELNQSREIRESNLGPPLPDFSPISSTDSHFVSENINVVAAILKTYGIL
jgi:hypothetical protein